MLQISTQALAAFERSQIERLLHDAIKLLPEAPVQDRHRINAALESFTHPLSRRLLEKLWASYEGSEPEAVMLLETAFDYPDLSEIDKAHRLCNLVIR